MYYNYLCIQIDHLLSVTLGMVIKCDVPSHFCRGRINSLFNMEKSVQQYKQAVRVIKDAILYSQCRAAKLVTIYKSRHYRYRMFLSSKMLAHGERNQSWGTKKCSAWYERNAKADYRKQWISGGLSVDSIEREIMQITECQYIWSFSWRHENGRIRQRI